MPSLLLMEDEEIIARNISHALRRVGHVVTHAASAREARAHLATGRFDLVLADISLGDGDGIDVLTAHADQLIDVPIVVMTGQDTTANRLRAEGIAVAAFMAKPFAISRLSELIGTLLANSGMVAGHKRGPSVMMYSHDTIGLGHMRRNAAIAEELVARVPGISVLMLVGCPAGMVFEPKAGIDYIKLPSLTKLGRDRWQAGSLRIDAATTRAMRAGILDRVIDTFQPDIFLVDHEPTGVWNELAAPLQAMRRRPGARAILGLRDILDDPDRTKTAWANSGTDRAIAELYDDLLIYGNAGFYPSDRAYGLDAMLPGHAHYCGAVTTARARRTDGWTGKPRRVLVSGGGGRDAYALLDSALAGQALLPRRKRPEMTLIAGPLMDEELRADLRRKAGDLGVAFHDSVPDMPARLSATDLFITMAGYNSVTEALAIGCPALVVPRVGPSSEQRLRANRLEELNLARVIWRADLTAAVMAQHLTAPVGKRQPPAIHLDFNGAACAAEFIAAVIDEQARTPAPMATPTRAEVIHV